MKKQKHIKGFTLIEVLIVIGIIAILASITIVAINPGRQFAQARNTQRLSNINSILNAIGQNSASNKGVFTCAAGTLPSSATNLGSAEYNIRPCLVPEYLPEIPLDPTDGTFTSATEYDSGYAVVLDASTKRITVSAPHAELGENISVTR